MSVNRIAYIDHIKNFLTCLVVAHHAAQAYGPTGGVWVVDDPEKAQWLGQFFFINASFMMGLYFFISGYFMVFSVKKKSPKQFMADRLKRLGIPLLFFTLLVFLPLNYLGSDGQEGVFAFFWNTYLYKAPIATGHLWFVAALLAFSFLYILIFKKDDPGKSSKTALKNWQILVYITLLTIVSGLVRLKYPIDEWHTWIIPIEVAHLPQYISLFFIGTIFNRNQMLDQIRPSQGVVFFIVAVAAYIMRRYLPASIGNYWLMESFIETLLCVGISMALLSLFRNYFTGTTKYTVSFSANGYGIYLFHVFVVIALQGLLLSWNVDPNIKFLLVTVFGILISYWITVMVRKIGWVKTII